MSVPRAGDDGTQSCGEEKENITFTVSSQGDNKRKERKCVKNLYVLTANQNDDTTNHGNFRLARFVVSSTVGALHTHAGCAQAGYHHDDTHYHEGTGGLEGT